MVTPRHRRELVAWGREDFRLSERRVCRAVAVHRALIRYRSIRPSQAPLRQRLRELASTRVSYGYKRLHVLLRREGWPVNHKRVHRLYREEELGLRPRRPTRRRRAGPRLARACVGAANERWAMDFVHDRLADGRSVRVFTLVDVHTRECLALEAGQGFRGGDVARILRAVGARRGLARTIQCDHGTEFTSTALDHWAYANHVQLDFSRPGKPTDNAFIESFNGTLRRECLSQSLFLSLTDTQAILTCWQEDYNNYRPHSSLGHRSPTQYRVDTSTNPVTAPLALREA